MNTINLHNPSYEAPADFSEDFQTPALVLDFKEKAAEILTDFFEDFSEEIVAEDLYALEEEIGPISLFEGVNSFQWGRAEIMKEMDPIAWRCMVADRSYEMLYEDTATFEEAIENYFETMVLPAMLIARNQYRAINGNSRGEGFVELGNSFGTRGPALAFRSQLFAVDDLVNAAFENAISSLNCRTILTENGENYEGQLLDAFRKRVLSESITPKGYITFGDQLRRFGTTGINI